MIEEFWIIREWKYRVYTTKDEIGYTPHINTTNTQSTPYCYSIYLHYKADSILRKSSA